MNIWGKTPKLSAEQVADIEAFLRAHKWKGAQVAIAKKHGISLGTLRRVIDGDYRPAPEPFFEPEAEAA